MSYQNSNNDISVQKNIFGKNGMNYFVKLEDSVVDISLNKNNSPTHSEVQIGLEKKRWLMLFVFSILSVSNGIQYSTFPPISILSAEYYQVDIFWINSLTNSFFILYVPFAFIVPLFFEKHLKMTVTFELFFLI